MRSPEYMAHGTSSGKDAEKIKEEGFDALEGRATVSGDLIYAFEWATEEERRRGSKSASEIDAEEQGRMIIMKVPEDVSVDYATHTDITVDTEKKEISGYSSKYESGRKQLAIYNEERSDPRVHVAQENILLSIVPTPELGEKLEELKREIRGLQTVDLDKFTEELSTTIESDKENFLSPGLDVREVVKSLLTSTMEAEVVNMVRALSMDVKRAQGYAVYNRGKDELKEKVVDKEHLKQKLAQALSIVESADFNTGMENLNRYLRINVKRLQKELV